MSQYLPEHNTEVPAQWCHWERLVAVRRQACNSAQFHSTSGLLYNLKQSVPVGQILHYIGMWLVFQLRDSVLSRIKMRWQQMVDMDTLNININNIMDVL